MNLLPTTARYNLAATLARFGHRDEALGHLKTADKLLPGDLEVSGALAGLP